MAVALPWQEILSSLPKQKKTPQPVDLVKDNIQKVMEFGCGLGNDSGSKFTLIPVFKSKYDRTRKCFDYIAYSVMLSRLESQDIKDIANELLDERRKREKKKISA